MKNFPIEHNGQTYWISRSTVVGMFVFTYSWQRSTWYVLANLRGQGCPNNVGKWNCPGGFIDYDENVYTAGCRECFEETGINPSYFTPVKFFSFNSEPTGSQNISFKLYAKDESGSLLNASLTSSNSEHNEVDDIRWIKIQDLNKYNWAFNHYNNIMEIYNKRINPSFWQKIKNYVIDKLS